MCKGWRVLAVTLPLLVAISGCRTAARLPAPALPAASTEHAGAELFRVDAAASGIWLYLRADGPLARVGHTHVITTQALTGSVWLHPQLAKSGCEFQLAVTALVVDDPQERTAAGSEFAEPLDDDARAGTREHMLGDQQLDAVHSPLVLLRCSRVSATPSGAVLDLTVTLRGHDAPLAVPVQWRRSGSLLEASGEFSFKQTTLGLEPYSALLGAMRVADEIHARFHIRAVAAAP